MTLNPSESDHTLLSLGGVVADLISWRVGFFVNVPPSLRFRCRERACRRVRSP
jgi:hypothetical protein